MTTVPAAVVERALYHRRQPVIVYDRGFCPGGATLVRNGKQVQRGWDEIVTILEAEGLGTWGQRQLARAAKLSKSR